jgi:hypothetical protein
MPSNKSRPIYDLKITELFGVAAFVGCGHYAFSLVHDFNTASTIAGALHSADVGVTSTVGVIAYSAYRACRSLRSRALESK